MTPERWQQVKAVVEQALEREPDERELFLDDTCKNDLALRQEVDSLLKADAGASGYLEPPTAAAALAGAEHPVADSDFIEHLQAGLGPAYVIERELGGGGMSRVFVAQETALGRRVVVKTLPPELAGGLDGERFHREIRLAASLQHPHVVPVHSAGHASGLLYYTMPFVEGESLRHRLEREGVLPVAEVVRLLREITEALCYAHRRGIIHRDLKPANILLEGGHALVTDFGIAKAIVAATGKSDRFATLTATGMVLGTPAYMAPEQAAGDQTDTRADLYALGCLAYELLTGRPPFAGTSAQALIAAHIAHEPEPVTSRRPGVPWELSQLVTRLLEKRPADRPQSADEVLRDLESVGARGRRAPPLRTLVVYVACSLAVLGVAYIAMVRLGLPDWVMRGAGAPAQPIRPVSVAVLPFRSLGPDQRDEYLSDGLTEDLINTLGRVPGIRVVARTSAFMFKGKAEDVRTVGAKLNVGAVVEGSVRRLGDTLRVTAQLVNVSDGYQMWAERYDRPSAGLLRLEEDVARSILGALRPGMANELDTARTGPTDNPEAYKLYLKGRYHLGKQTEADFRAAVRYFDQAIGLDPTFALAYSGLSGAYGSLYGTFLPAADGMPKAKAAALKALELDPELADGYSTLGGVQMTYEWDWRGAERSFQRAVELQPSDAGARGIYGSLLVVLGRFDEAAIQLDQARRLDPLSLHIEVTATWPLYYGRRYDEAIAALRKTVAADSSFVGAQFRLGEAYIHKGEFRLAEARLQAASALIGNHSDVVGRMGYLYAVSGRREEARVIVDTLRARYRKGRSDEPYDLAIVYAGLGEKEKALDWLDTAYAERSSWVTFVKVSPELDTLRNEPRFQALLGKLALD